MSKKGEIFMTDMLHKPIGWDDPLNQMTEEEWKEYFRLREELDVEMNNEEIIAALRKVDELLEQNRHQEANSLMGIIHVHPRLAYAWKLGLGLKEVMNLNLSLAKKEYPDEF